MATSGAGLGGAPAFWSARFAGGFVSYETAIA